MEQNAATRPEVIYLSAPMRPAQAMEMTQQERVAAALMKAGSTTSAAWTSDEGAQSSVALEVVPSSTVAENNGVAKDEPADCGYDMNPPLVLMKAKNDRILLISSRSERSQAKALAWKSTLAFISGAALMFIGVYLLLQRMQWL
jgi:hypothetical protein